MLAFAGAPAAFPVAAHNVELHRYLRWASLIENESENFIRDEIKERPYLGIHLRNGVDWVSIIID